MNKVFADHVTSTAFFLSMSKQQIRVLLAVVEHPWKKSDKGAYTDAAIEAIRDLRDPVSAGKALERKGLTEWVIHERGHNGYINYEHGHRVATKAGVHCAALLREAGFGVELPTKSKKVKV